MKTYTVKLVDKNIAKKLIIDNHYSHKWTSCRYALGLFHNDVLLGTAVYGYPVGRQVVKSICNWLANSDVLELTRLWVDDSEPRNTETYFLSKTFEWLRKNSSVKILIAYSDPLFGHLGFVYQAGSWLYQGNNTMLIKGFLHEINGELLHPRTVVAKYGTILADTLVKIDPNYRRLPMKKKHRYLFILQNSWRKKIVKTLKHPLLPYPKEDNNSSW